MASVLVGVVTAHSEKVKPVGRCGVFLFPDSAWQGGKAGAAPDQPRGREAALLSSPGAGLTSRPRPCLEAWASLPVGMVANDLSLFSVPFWLHSLWC